MQRFLRAEIPQSEVERIVSAARLDYVQRPDVYSTLGPWEEIEQRIRENAVAGETWKNDRYQVCVVRGVHPPGWPEMVHLSIKRVDKDVMRDWRELQEIKNALVGPECEAVELFPAESRLVDSANQYHLWALADPGRRFPFGFGERFVDDAEVGGSRQRPRRS